MTEDRKIPAITSRLDNMARSGFVCCKRKVFALLGLLLFSVFCPLSSVFGEGIEVRKAELHYSGDSFHLSADFDIRLKFVVEQALEQGISLYFISEFTLTHPRWYWLEETVTQNEQSFKLSYNALTRQYRIARGALFQNFASLDDALNLIDHQSSLPIPAEIFRPSGYLAELLPKRDNSYVAAVRLRLDVTQLPKPLQVNALTGNDWNMDSDWYRWIVHPDLNARGKDK